MEFIYAIYYSFCFQEPRVAVITLRAPQTQQRKKVVWTEDTVDNENMNKKKSKCTYIFFYLQKYCKKSI